MASAASIFPEIAGFNPTATMQQSQLRQQQLGLNALQAQRQQAEIPLLQQQTQQAGLQNQLVQQQINDQRAIGAAWAQWDPDQDPSGQGLLKKAVQNGATPESVMGVQRNLATYNASIATADKTRLENQKARDDDYAGKMQAIIDAPPEQQEQLWQAHVADFAKDAPGEQIPPHFTAQDAKTFQNLHQFRSQQIENELKKRQAENEAAGTLEKQAATEKDKAEAERLKAVNALLKQGHDAQTTPGQHPIDAILSAQDDPGLNASLKGMYDRGAQFINPTTGISSVQEEALKLAATAKHEITKANNPTLQAGEAKTAKLKVEAENPAMVQRQVDTQHALETLTPDQQRLAQGIADYRVAPIGGFALSRPENRGVMAAAMALNPEYREENYQAYQHTENDAATGNIAKQTVAAKTVLGHFGTLSQAADALKNNNIPLINSIAQAIGVQVGATPKTTYDTILHRIGPEITKAYIASGGRANERGANEEDFASKLGPDQIKNNIGVSAHLLGTKMDALQNQYNEGTFGRGQRQLLNPQDRQTISTLEGKANTPAIPKGGRYRANGTTYNIPANKEADFLKDHPNAEKL